MMAFFYNILISLLTFGFRLGQYFNPKIQKGWLGRRESLSKVKQTFRKDDKVLWMHAASLGEYEQGLPVLQALKEKHPDYKILITFFSPSGYEQVVKKNNIADVICYLPFDNKNSVQEFVNAFDTKIFFTVKYDYWYHLLKALKQAQAKVFVVSALFYPSQVFFRPYGKWFVRQLQPSVDWFFHQTQTSMDLATSIGLRQSSVSGDTRFDRVKAIKHQAQKVPFIKVFKQDNPLVIFGSVWEAEENIAQGINTMEHIKIIIAPHDLKRVSHIKTLFPDALLYSNIEQKTEQLKEAKVLIIDSIGWLSKLYAYADIAVVGGGFHSAGLHNILEAATYGVPVLFGNHYRKNPEADALIKANGGQSFSEPKDCIHFIKTLLQNKDMVIRMGKNAEFYIHQQPNATQTVVEKISNITTKR